MSLRSAGARWRHRTQQLREEWSVRTTAWHHERAIERAVAHDGPVVVGPWLSEVGYEVLYWIPFVRWVQAAYRVKPERLIVMSRGGVASWYADITRNYAEIFDFMTPAEYAQWQQQRTAAGRSAKQLGADDLDERLLAAVRTGPIRDARVLHPSMMFGLFAAYWSGQQGTGFVEARTRFVPIAPPALDLSSLQLPSRYVAAKFYGARALPVSGSSRQLVSDLVGAISRRTPVVLLESGTALDEHADFAVEGGHVVRVGPHLETRTNLAVQTQIIAGAEAFVGTCGSLAWLAPMIGVDTTAVMTDGRLLHAHVHVARRVYQRMNRGRFSPADLGTFPGLGVTVDIGAQASRV